MAIRYANYPEQERKEFGVPGGNETESKEQEVIPTENSKDSPESPPQHDRKAVISPSRWLQGL